MLKRVIVWFVEEIVMKKLEGVNRWNLKVEERLMMMKLGMKTVVWNGERIEESEEDNENV